MFTSSIARAAFAASLLLASGPVALAQSDDAAAKTPQFTVSSGVKRVYVELDRTVFTLDAEPRCRDPRYEFPETHPRFDQLTALLLAAVAAGKSVTIEDAVCLEETGRAGVGRMYIDR